MIEFCNEFYSILDLTMTILRAFFKCFFEAETQLEKSTKKTKKKPQTHQDKPVLPNEREALRRAGRCESVS